MSDHLTIRDLTPQERMWLSRRRLGMTQRAAAAHYNMPHNTYRDQEQGALEPLHVSVPGPLAPYERCALARRRCGETQETVAAALFVSAKTIRAWERGEGDCTDLICYWDC